MEVEHRYADLGDVRLHCVEAGSGPLVVLLHGFPEFWYSWQHQIPALAEAGFRVVAPDMRGYNLSDKPRGYRSYELELLSRDVARLIEWCGEERACVAGHDWGAAVAWDVAMRHPERVERLAILNLPHPRRLLQGWRGFDQLRRSWYMFFFQLPLIPEAWLRVTDYAFFRRAFANDPVHPGAFSGDDVERFVETWRRPGAMTSMIAYYRAALRRPVWRVLRDMRPIDLPVLVIWGEQDRYLSSSIAEPEREWVRDVRVERVPDASHWVQNDAPERVNELLLDFFSTVREAAAAASTR